MLVDVDARVLANQQLSDTYNILELEAPAIAAECQPGQFVMVKTALGQEPLLRRPFSVFERLRNRHGLLVGISLLSKRIGKVTQALFAVEPGEYIRCLGPLGQRFTIVEPPMSAWMVAGGVGLAPFATLAEALAERQTNTTLFYGGRTAADLYHLSFFRQLGVRIILTTEDGSKGEPGRITEPLKRELQTTSGRSTMIYACGPTRMMQAVAELGTSANRPTEVSLEPIMGCGLGGCYSCVVPVRTANTKSQSHFVRSCLEGPVFSGTEIIWPNLI